MLCDPCLKRIAAYNKARYRAAPKPWPRKVMCARCRKRLRETRRVWRARWVDGHRAQVNEAQRRYRRRVKRAANS